MHRRLCSGLVGCRAFTPLLFSRAAARPPLPRRQYRNKRLDTKPKNTVQHGKGAPTTAILSVDDTEYLQDFLVDLAEALHEDEQEALHGEPLAALKHLEPTKLVKEELAHVTHSQKLLSELSADALALMLDDEEEMMTPPSPSSNFTPSTTVMEVAEHPSSPSSSLTVTEGLLQRMQSSSGQPLADKLVLLLQLCASTADLPRGFPLASQELLHGTDLKAILPTGNLSRLYLKEVHLTHMDSTAVRWDGVTARRCTLKQSIFYKAHFQNCTFYHCSFDSCVLKGLRLSGTVKFMNCSFTFANLALHVDRGANVIFKNCDFDLADFAGSTGLCVPSFFVNCTNIKTAASFPLRAR